MKVFTVRAFVVCLFVSAALIVSGQAMAKKGGGNGKGYGSSSSQTTAKSTPPGWEHGKKTGWAGGKYPPGWSKWDEGKKEKWVTDRDSAQADIERICERYRIEERTRNEISEAFDEAIVGGKIIDDSRKKLVAAIENEKDRKKIVADTMEAVSQILK